MQEAKTYSVKEAADLLGCSVITIRRRIKENQLRADLPSDKEGYRISEESLREFAAKHDSQVGSLWSKGATETAAAVGASAALGVAVGAAAAPLAASSLLIGGPLGMALGTMFLAYSNGSESKRPVGADIQNNLPQLDSPLVIDKVIERLKTEQKDFDLKIKFQELKASQASDEEKLAEQEKVLQLELQKNQVTKDINDLEIRKALLEQERQQNEA